MFVYCLLFTFVVVAVIDALTMFRFIEHVTTSTKRQDFYIVYT